jgi:hypothetical protein
MNATSRAFKYDANGLMVWTKFCINHHHYNIPKENDCTLTTITSTLKMEENVFFQNVGTKYKMTWHYNPEDNG